MHRFGLACIGALTACLAVSTAHAQTGAADVVSTAPAKGEAQSPDTAGQIADWIKDAPPLGLSDDNDGVIAMTPERGIHGEAGAFVSNRGYGGYVAATAPVGKNAEVGLAVGDEQFNGRYIHANERSLAASLRVGPQAQRPAGCADSLLVDGRYVQPLWVGQLRGASDAPVQCAPPSGGR